MPYTTDFHGIISTSETIRRLFAQLRRIADAGGPVLLLGESGVGKELVARAIHAEGGRRDGPFVALNCAGIPPGLLESELFGHAAGAFTGAQEARAGLFAEATGGSLLLDEIGDMPIEMQAKLLRLLEGGQVRPVGDNQERSFDVRIIAATNRDLEQDIEQGRFRSDLYYRLETFSIRIPPLRERPDDIRPLALHFIRQYAGDRNRDIKGITPAALARLHEYPFPGNVRELANAIEHGVALSRHAKLDVMDLPERIRDHHAGPASTVSPLPALFENDRLPTLKEVEQHYIRHVLARLGGNKQRTAERLGIGRRTLYRYLDPD